MALTWLDDRAGAEAVAARVKAAGRRAHLIKADVSKLAEVEARSEKDLAKRIKLLERQMLDHAKNLEFEEAANLRDRIKSLRQKLVGKA